MGKEKRQYGLWTSPVSAEMLAAEARLSDVQWAGDGETLLWLERREGRGVLMVRRPGAPPRVVNDRVDIRGGCGYGGGEFSVRGQHAVFATRQGRLFRAHLDEGIPQAITPQLGGVAAPAISPDGKWVVFVHSHGDEDQLAVVDARGAQWPQIAVKGGDFYMQPTWHPAGDRLAWVRWDHPQMPWMGAYLETAKISQRDGQLTVGEVERIAGSESVAVQQPEFSPDGERLAYLSDESGWWQVVVRELVSGEERVISEAGREYGGPAWAQGLRYMGWAPDSQSVFAVSASEGVSRLDRLSLRGEIEKVRLFTEYTSLGQIAVSSAVSGSKEVQLACVGQSSTVPPRIVSAVVGGASRVEKFGSSERLRSEDLSRVRPLSWPVKDKGIDEVYGLYYPPTSSRFAGEGKPPAIVMIHGGPTSQRVAKWEATNQYFASRGFAVLDVNYRGSTGYGRAYMEALFGKWGVADVEDGISGAQFLVDEGLADPKKLVIMGGSAGGYTVLQTLVSHPGAFKAGVCLYGISDVFALQMGTHKFESHYNDTLIGVLPQAADRFRERSPLFSAEKIQDAVAIYHGAQDRVVPVEQAEMIVESLQRRGVTHIYHRYEGEGHGWRHGETIVHFHASVLEFLLKEVIYR